MLDHIPLDSFGILIGPGIIIYTYDAGSGSNKVPRGPEFDNLPLQRRLRRTCAG